MAQIKVLPQEVRDKIAAGEVVERPAAAVKELVENSIDAGADRIRVEIKNGGIKLISVEDNGKGIPKDELETSFLRHATSKIEDIDDLFEIMTMGFRGEALSSICAVGDVRVISRTKDSDEGTVMTVKNGVMGQKSAIACNFGTTMVIENLFANVPARMKFLKKDSLEAGYVTDVLSRIALANPNIAFSYISDDKEVFSTSGDGKLKNAILNIYGIDHARNVYEADYEEHGVHVFGVLGKSELARGNRTRQTLFVNGRYIKNHVISKVVEEAYRNALMTGKFPFFVLNINLSPSLVDVNVHPQKTEIKFANEKEIYSIVHAAVKNALYGMNEDAEKKQTQNLGFYGDTRTNDSPDKRIIKEFMERTTPDKEEPRGYSFKSPELTNDSYLPKEESLAKEYIDTDKLFLKDTPKPQENLFGEVVPTAGIQKTEGIKKDEPMTVIGQAFDTYVIAQQRDELFLIDQHAAHERRRFEMLKKDYETKSASGQGLLSPIVIDVEAAELQAIKDNSELLLNMGFLIEEFGRGSAIIRETPFIGDEDEIKSLAMEVISALLDGRPMGLLSFEERLLDMISCKYAIKANKKLSLIEMEGIIKDVLDLESKGITTCPHGRPIKISLTKKEIEKSFKRIV